MYVIGHLYFTCKFVLELALVGIMHYALHIVFLAANLEVGQPVKLTADEVGENLTDTVRWFGK
jgi:hypothetical protein